MHFYIADPRPDWCPLVTEAQNIDDVLDMCYEMGGGE
jgi:hypothetical protein